MALFFIALVLSLPWNFFAFLLGVFLIDFSPLIDKFFRFALGEGDGMPSTMGVILTAIAIGLHINGMWFISYKKRGNSAKWKKNKNGNRHGGKRRKKLKSGFSQPGCWSSDCRHPLIGFLSVGVFIYGSESLAGFSGRVGRYRRFTGDGRGIVDEQWSALYGYRTTLRSIARRQYVLVPEIGVAVVGGGANISHYIDWMSSGKACRIFNKKPMKKWRVHPSGRGIGD